MPLTRDEDIYAGVGRDEVSGVLRIAFNEYIVKLRCRAGKSRHRGGIAFEKDKLGF